MSNLSSKWVAALATALLASCGTVGRETLRCDWPKAMLEEVRHDLLTAEPASARLELEEFERRSTKHRWLTGWFWVAILQAEKYGQLTQEMYETLQLEVLPECKVEAPPLGLHP